MLLGVNKIGVSTVVFCFVAIANDDDCNYFPNACTQKILLGKR